MEIDSFSELSPTELHWQLSDGPELYNTVTTGKSYTRKSYPQLRTEYIRRVARLCHWPEFIMDLDRVLYWHAELEARAAARAHFWLEEEHPAAMHQEPASIAQVQSRRLTFVTRSQILRAFEPLSPEELEEHLSGAEQLIRHWQAVGHAVAYLLRLESARGSIRPLRPPGAEEEPIRVPPHRPTGRADAKSAEEQREYSSSIAVAFNVAATGTTSKERNMFSTARTCLLLATLRVLNHELPLVGAERQPVLQRTNSTLSVCLASLGETTTGDCLISRRYFLKRERQLQCRTKQPSRKYNTSVAKRRKSNTNTFMAASARLR